MFIGTLYYSYITAQYHIFETSLYYRYSSKIVQNGVTCRKTSPGTRSPAFQNAIDARIALAMVRDSSEILRGLLAGGHSTYAGRLAGGFRNIGKDRIADEIITTMRGAGYDVREIDPFENHLEISLPRERSPYANRIRLMWLQMREVAIRNFPPPPGIKPNHEAYLKAVDDVYVTDAYHSLSIERYRVSPELVEGVRRGQWDIFNREEDRNQRDAMAARG